MENSNGSIMKSILDESAPAADILHKHRRLSASIDPLLVDLENDSDHLSEFDYSAIDSMAKTRFQIILNDELSIPAVRNIVNLPNNFLFKTKSRLSKILPRNLLMHLLDLPTFAVFSVEMLILIAFSMLPMFILKMFFYPVIRLLFGVLYPAYASYKAVRTKDVKKYVSITCYTCCV